MQRLVLLSYFEPKDVGNLLSQVRRARLPADVAVYVGSYGPNPGVARQVAGARERALRADVRADGGVVPATTAATARVRAAGTEASGRRGASPPPAGLDLGPRCVRRRAGGTLPRRDSRGGRRGLQLDAWQFDEVVPSAAAAGSRAVRELTRGVLRGLLFGRPVLGDVSMRGFVWVAHSALAIGRLPITAEQTTFWRTLIGRPWPTSVRNTRG